MDEQRRIVSLVKNIQKKIKLNSEINQNIFDQIQALYCSKYDVSAHASTGVLLIKMRNALLFMIYIR